MIRDYTDICNPGSGGSGNSCQQPADKRSPKDQMRLDLIAKFWTSYQVAWPSWKIDFTAADVEQMLILAEIAGIATESGDGQP